MKKQDQYEVVPFPKIRQPVIDSLSRAARMHVTHALLEVDVTEARNRLRKYKNRTGDSLSFTAFLTYCLAQVVDENKILHAYRRGSKLIIYNEVDISVIIEREIADERIPLFPHVVKAANHKSLMEIHEEIRAAQVEDVNSFKMTKWINLYYYLPGFIRALLWEQWLGSPSWRKRLTGTVGISSVGMFGKGPGWGIPVPTYNLNVTVGGISGKPCVIDGQLATREYLCLTVSFNHDTIDGAPMARFMQRYRELIESSCGLQD